MRAPVCLDTANCFSGSTALAVDATGSVVLSKRLRAASSMALDNRPYRFRVNGWANSIVVDRAAALVQISAVL
jgi:hypothetical protein